MAAGVISPRLHDAWHWGSPFALIQASWLVTFALLNYLRHVAQKAEAEDTPNVLKVRVE